MAKFVDFKDSISGTPVAVNPDHVAKVRPAPDDPNNITVIRLKDGDEIGVEGKHTDVVKKLATA
jgi:uncharacterized protein YlzI (FlbEa/FlbD family)